jgi:hypothetical protein
VITTINAEDAEHAEKTHLFVVSANAPLIVGISGEKSCV